MKENIHKLREWKLISKKIFVNDVRVFNSVHTK